MRNWPLLARITFPVLVSSSRLCPFLVDYALSILDAAVRRSALGLWNQLYVSVSDSSNTGEGEAMRSNKFFLHTLHVAYVYYNLGKVSTCAAYEVIAFE